MLIVYFAANVSPDVVLTDCTVLFFAPGKENFSGAKNHFRKFGCGLKTGQRKISENLFRPEQRGKKRGAKKNKLCQDIRLPITQLS